MDNYKQYIGQIFPTVKYGPLQITGFTGKYYGKIKIPIMTAKFLISEAEIEIQLYDATAGVARDPRYGLNFNKIYQSDLYGPYVVLDTKPGATGKAPVAVVKFLNTLNIKEIRIQDVTSGACYDDSAKQKCHIDMNLVAPEDREAKYIRYAKNMHYSMKKRVFNSNAKNYPLYGGLGVTIDKRWMDFDEFYNDLKYLFQYDKWLRWPTMYQIDKDYLQQNVPHENRVYSKDTCVFLHLLDNINLKNIEYRRDHQDELPSKYYGVTVDKRVQRNPFSVHFIVNGQYQYFGMYDDEIYAAGIYNYWYAKFHQYDIIPLFNDVPTVDPSQFPPVAKYQLYKLI